MDFILPSHALSMLLRQVSLVGFSVTVIFRNISSLNFQWINTRLKKRKKTFYSDNTPHGLYDPSPKTTYMWNSRFFDIYGATVRPRIGADGRPAYDKFITRHGSNIGPAGSFSAVAQRTRWINHTAAL